MLSNIDKLNYYKSYLDKIMSNIDKLINKSKLDEIDEKKLIKFIHNAEYFLLICNISNVNHISDLSRNYQYNRSYLLKISSFYHFKTFNLNNNHSCQFKTSFLLFIIILVLYTLNPLFTFYFLNWPF